MDSSRITDEELATRIRTLDAAELAAWVFASFDEVLATSGCIEEAGEHRAHLCERISRNLSSKQEAAFIAELAGIWCRTDVDDNGNRVDIDRAQRRRRERDLKKWIENEARTPDGEQSEELAHEHQPAANEGMTVDANGKILMNSEKLAEILGISVQELEARVEEMVAENPDLAGYCPGLDNDGNVVPLKVFHGGTQAA